MICLSTWYRSEVAHEKDVGYLSLHRENSKAVPLIALEIVAFLSLSLVNDLVLLGQTLAAGSNFQNQTNVVMEGLHTGMMNLAQVQTSSRIETKI